MTAPSREVREAAERAAREWSDAQYPPPAYSEPGFMREMRHALTQAAYVGHLVGQERGHADATAAGAARVGERRELRDALGRYGRHEWNCATTHDDAEAAPDDQRCDCGLARALAATPPVDGTLHITDEQMDSVIHGRATPPVGEEVT